MSTIYIRSQDTFCASGRSAIEKICLCRNAPAAHLRRCEIAHFSRLIMPNTWVKGHRQLDEVQLVIVLSRRLVRDDDDDDHKRSSVVLYEPMQLITVAI
jgi:hypothetical protein